MANIVLDENEMKELKPITLSNDTACGRGIRHLKGKPNATSIRENKYFALQFD
jgi:hypothetical protein